MNPAILLSLVFSLAAPAAFAKTVNYLGVEYDCSDLRRDSDEMAAACAGIAPDETIDNMLVEIGPRRVFLTYDEVMERLTPYLESQFDAFIIANSAVPIVKNKDGKPVVVNDVGLVAPQHILIVKKKRGESVIFQRDSNGVVRGINTAETAPIADGVPFILPTSSGANHFMRSFSGIFHVNHQRSIAMNDRNRRTNFEVPMSNAIYFGYIYTDTPAEKRSSRTSNPRVSYGAMHGTPPANNKLLGKQRASHGCLRIDARLAQKIFPAVMAMDGQIPKFDWLHALPLAKIQNASWKFGDGPATGIPTVRGKKVLMIVFNGHGESEHAVPSEWNGIDI